MKYFIFLLFISCADLSYMVEQGAGQISLEWNGKPNEKVLKDKSIKDEYKRKIEIVQKAKKYFFEYYDLKPNTIYDQTTFLDQDAVTYLVIHSPRDEIKALKSCFPIAGCFPYQGFFKLKSAKKYQQEKEDLGHHTYMRPVYAYSTLNHPLIPFSDNILSSFFHYQDDELVGLIFHELVHTIIFVKNEAQFNENFAEFISHKMLVEYRGWDENYVEDKAKQMDAHIKLNDEIVRLSDILKKEYKKRENKPDFVLRNFLVNTFEPAMKQYCEELNISESACWPLKQKWNNARFAALRTYTAKQTDIENIFKKMNLSLKEFMHKIIKYENDYNKEEKFLEYLQKKVR